METLGLVLIFIGSLMFPLAVGLWVGAALQESPKYKSWGAKGAGVGALAVFGGFILILMSPAENSNLLPGEEVGGPNQPIAAAGTQGAAGKPHYPRAISAAVEQDWDEALKQLYMVPKTDPDFTRAQKKIAEYKKNRDEKMRAVRASAEIEAQPLIVTDYKIRDGYVVGTAENRSDKSFQYVEVTFNLYNRSGGQVGNALDNVESMGPHGTWEFRAPMTVDDADHAELNGIDSKPFGRDSGADTGEELPSDEPAE